MASWQPPIPSGALYSRPARNLGSALALLAWCYDAVQRDGCFDLQLKEVAHEMDEPYHTVVKWWAKLQSGVFFVSVTDRGRAGFRVQFHDDWIDWRILNARGTKTMNRFELPEMVTETQQRDTSQLPNPVIEYTEMTSMTPEKLLNNSSITPQLPNPVIENDTYKEDMSHDTRDRATEVAPSRKRALKSPQATQATLLETPLSIYRQVTNNRNPNQAQREIIETVTDLDCWRATCEEFAIRGWKVRDLANMIDNYTKRLNDKKKAEAQRARYQQPASYQNGSTQNGHAPSEPLDLAEAAKRTAEIARTFPPIVRGGSAGGK